MKIYLTIILVLFSVVSCVPPGKLNDVLQVNNILIRKYDSLNQKLKETTAYFAKNIEQVNSSMLYLKDSINYYRSVANKPTVISGGEVFLNQMLGLSLISKEELVNFKINNDIKTSNNVWLERFNSDLKKFKNADIKINKGYIFIEISDKILFTSGSITLTKKSNEILTTLASLLQDQPDLNFMIEGHTDNKAFKKRSINDNWSLSVNRATAIAKILQTKFKINPKRIIAAGRSEFMPIDDNKTKTGRSNNRRIRIVIMPTVMQIMNFAN